VRIVGGLIFALVLVAIALVGVEVALRSSDASSIFHEVRKYPLHPFLQATPAQAADHVNPQGFRGDSVALVKPANTFRVFAIGGSTTLGVTNTYPDSYPAMLQEELRRRHPAIHIEVLNAGCPWYTSAHALVSYTVEVRQYQPDLVIFFEAINDLVRSGSPPWLANGPFKPDYSHYLGPYARLLGPNASYINGSSSLAWNKLSRRLGWSPDPFDIRNARNVSQVAGLMRALDAPSFRSLPSFRQYSDAIIHFVKADGHAIMTASQASLFRPDLNPEELSKLWFGPLLAAENGTYPSTSAMLQGMENYNAAAREVAAANGTPFIDFAAAVPKTLQYFVDDVHLKAAGNAILAREAANAIDAAGLVQRAAAAPGRPLAGK